MRTSWIAQELSSVLVVTSMGRKSKEEGMYEYIWLIHLAVQKKLANQPNQHEATSSNKKDKEKFLRGL